MLFSKACDFIGIVAIACAQHGCFAPDSIVDLFLGERQKNVDWSFLEAIQTTNVDPDQGIMFIYDIICQYFLYLKFRISHLLHPDLEIDRAIGLFHVHDHKEDHFYRFASSFIPGVGIVAGEILESLWSQPNPIAIATRTATLAHHAKVIDEHASDSNQKELVGISESGPEFELLNPNLPVVSIFFCDRFRQATDMVHKTSSCYMQLSSTIAVALRKKWEEEVTSAENQRLEDPSAMDIIGAQDVNLLTSRSAPQPDCQTTAVHG
jgi:hypothetical protein